MRTFLTYLVTLLFIASLSACAGKSRAEKKAQAENADTVDITLPPELVIEKSDDPTETNPDDTVSFDKWQKKQSEDE